MIDAEKRLRMEILCDELCALINEAARDEAAQPTTAMKPVEVIEVVRFARAACHDILDAALADGRGGCELCGS